MKKKAKLYLKKFLVVVFVLLSVIVLNSCAINVSESMEDNNVLTFGNVNLIEVDLNTVKQMQQNGERFYLYMGRDDCPYCDLFLEGLSRLELSSELVIYYLDSFAPYEEAPEEIKIFRDAYFIETVPSLQVFEGNKLIEDLKDYIVDGTDLEVIAFLSSLES